MTLEKFLAHLELHGSVSRYDPCNEPKPNHPWSTFDKAKVNDLLQKFADTVRKAIDGVPDSDTELQHLYKTANGLSQVQRSPAIKVGLVGAQGAGKSLLTNAIFSRDGLSLTGADGAACTSAVIEYANYPSENDDDAVKYFAQIKLLDAAKREGQIKWHARAYHYYNDEDDDSDDDDVPKPKKRNRDEADRRANDTAIDFFVTLHESKEKFQESWSLEHYKSGEFVELCQMRCQAAIAKLDMTSTGIAQFAAKDQKELIKKIKPFLTNVKGQFCMWPLVDSVKIRFRHELLEEGIELVDVPGWGDSNMERVRHADEVKDRVDVEILLADTIRIASDDVVINNARAAAAIRGAESVKLVATKIDALSSNQLEQCTGYPFDEINEMIEKAEEEEQRANDDGDTTAEENIAIYKLYLERHLKVQKVEDRAVDITAQLSTKFPSQSREDNPEVFHASASNYMNWIKRPKLKYADQPALSPGLTGIPSIRQFLRALPASNNLRDYAKHMNVRIPGFIEKIKRTVADSDRDTGFRDLADEFDVIRAEFIKMLQSEMKVAFENISKNGIAKVRLDADSYKQQVNRNLKNQWLTLPALVFKKIVACKGVIVEGSSKSKALQNGCNWNHEIADTVAPGFNKWLLFHSRNMKDMAPALSQALIQAHDRNIKMMEDSSANLVVVEKAKKKWSDFRPKMQAKVSTLMKDIDKLEKKSNVWATMQDGRENNLITKVMERIYDAVFAASPATKVVTGGKHKGKTRYVKPRIAFQKDYLAKLVMDSGTHLVDDLIDQFQKSFDKYMGRLIDNHCLEMDKLLEEYSVVLRKQAPVDYVITPVGEDIRKKLDQLIPTLVEKSHELIAQVPESPKQEDDTATHVSNEVVENTGETVSEFFDQIRKRKRTGDDRNSIVRIKKEY